MFARPRQNHLFTASFMGSPLRRHLLDSEFRQMAAIPDSAELFMSGLIERFPAS
jgi:hypothetical protein